MKLLHKNFIFNILLGVTNIIVPLIVFPYISEILEPDGVGITSFAVSLASTFVILGSLGIPIYGIREIAKAKKSDQELSKTFSEIVSIQVIWLVFTLLIYFFWIFFTNTFQHESEIKLASFFHIVGLIGMINWFFQGIEKYKFITVVNIIVKGLTIVLLFVLVKNREDYWIYYWILVGSTIVGSIISLSYGLQFVRFRTTNLNLQKHIKPIGILFSTQIAIGIYVNLDILFLKYFSTNEQVGLYTAASKVIKISLLIVTSLGTVLIPKISQLIEKNQFNEIQKTIEKSLQFVLFIGCPIMILLVVLAPEIIQIFAGDQFLFSVGLIQLLTPLIFFIGMSTVFGLQILVPFQKEKQLLFAVSIGAVVSIILNSVLIPKYQSEGAVYTIVITELIIMICTYYYAKKAFSFKYPYKKGLTYMALSALFIPISMLLHKFFDAFLYISIVSICSFILYIIGLYLIKDTFFMNTIWRFFIKNKK